MDTSILYTSEEFFNTITHKFLRFTILLFILLFVFLICSGCLSTKGKVLLRYEGYFIEYDKYITYSEPPVEIHILTNFPSDVSVVVARGIFGVEKILDMKCSKTEKKGIYLCSVKIPEDTLEKGELYFWFLVDIGGDYYSIPNFYLLKDKLFEYLGKVEKKEKKKGEIDKKEFR